MSLKDFLLLQLQIEECLVEKLIHKDTLRTREKECFIYKAIDYGCSYKFIAQVLPIRKAEITNIAREFGLTEVQMKLRYKNRVLLFNGHVTIFS